MVKIGACRLLEVYFKGDKTNLLLFQIMGNDLSTSFRILETAEDMAALEDLQTLVWPDSERDIVPAHMLVTVVHNGGLLVGAFSDQGEESLLIGLL